MSETCTLAVHRTDSGYLCRIAGRGTLRESPAVRDFASSAMQSGADVVLDLSGCEFLDSTFLGCLLILHQRGVSGRGSFAVVADESIRRKLLRSVRADRVLRFLDQPPDCIGSPVTLEVLDVTRSEFGRHLRDSHYKLAELGGPAAATFRDIAKQLEKDLHLGPG